MDLVHIANRFLLEALSVFYCVGQDVIQEPLFLSCCCSCVLLSEQSWNQEVLSSGQQGLLSSDPWGASRTMSQESFQGSFWDSPAMQNRSTENGCGCRLPPVGISQIINDRMLMLCAFSCFCDFEVCLTAEREAEVPGKTAGENGTLSYQLMRPG